MRHPSPRAAFASAAVLCAVLLPAAALATHHASPVCRAIGSKSEGWYAAVTGELLAYAQCGDCGTTCKADRWYDMCSDKPIGAASCAEGSAVFKDVPESRADARAIAYVEGKGIVSGYPDGTYRPDAGINRAEFVKIIALSTNTEEQITGLLARADIIPFPDVPEREWFARYVQVARAEGHVGGYPDGTFRPTAGVNVAEASKIVVHAFGLDRDGLPACAGDCPWWKPYVQAMRDIGGIGADADAGAALTRGGMAVMVRAAIGVQDGGIGQGQPPAGGCKIGGCSAQLCVPEGEDGVSTCEWRPEYACYAEQRCERQPDGLCGWTMTPQLQGCLESAGKEMP